MKTIVVLVISAVCIFAISAAYAADGQAIFKSQGCMTCHKKEGTSKINPSLAEISQTYQGKEAQLIQYLKGESDPIVRPQKGSMMKRQIEKTKNLSDADRKALADYMLGLQ